MGTVQFILNKYGLNGDSKRMPIEIPNTGRNELARLFAELGFKAGAEIGVERGLYSEVLCRANPDLHLYAVDAWKAYRGYREHVTQSKLDGFYVEAEGRMAPYDCELIREFSMDAVKRFKLNSLDFVYIDGNHSLKYIIQDIDEWSRRVKPGGIVSGHDFKKTKAPIGMLHVVQAVHAYTSSYRIHPWFVLGRRERRDGEIRDKSRSWVWVKT